eukprot:symbB.v1.2.019812.t1/scaffold1640.1/size107948/1
MAAALAAFVPSIPPFPRTQPATSSGASAPRARWTGTPQAPRRWAALGLGLGIRCGQQRTRFWSSKAEVEAGALDDAFVGRRLRVWFVSEEELADYEYATVAAVHDDGEVTIQWDGQGEERLKLSEISFEWLGHDLAADVVANLRESRQESLEGATEAGAEVVAMPVEQLRKELSAMSWMRKELEARRQQAEELRRENEELKAARAEFEGRYGELGDPPLTRMTWTDMAFPAAWPSGDGQMHRGGRRWKREVLSLGAGAVFHHFPMARSPLRRCGGSGPAKVGRCHRHRPGVAVWLVLLLLCFWSMPIDAALAFDGASLASAAVEQMRDGPLGPVPFMFTHLVAIVVCFPGTAAFELAAGAVFGFLPGVLAVAITKGAAAAVTFFLARRFGADLAQRAAGAIGDGSWTSRVQRGVQGNAFRFCLLARLSPIPSWVNNYALPLADVRFETFLPATLLGMLPPLAANVYSGACALSLASALTGGGGTVDGGSLVLGVLSALSGAAAPTGPFGSLRGEPIEVAVTSAQMEDLKADQLKVKFRPDGSEVTLNLFRAAGGKVVAEVDPEQRWGISSVDGWELGQPGPGSQWRPHRGVKLKMEEWNQQGK